MKKIIYLVLFAFITSTGCRKIEVDGNSGNDSGNNPENKILEGRITSNLTLKDGNVYKLRGLVYVTNGAILTIEPGVKIVGESGRKGGLIITRDSKIIADGKPEKPAYAKPGACQQKHWHHPYYQWMLPAAPCGMEYR